MNKKIESHGSGRSPIVGKTTDGIRDKIFMQEYKSGFQLTETLLAEEYGISRVSVRSALFVLEKEGLVAAQANGRKVVLGINEKYVRDLYHMRNLLECEAIRCCIRDKAIDYSRLAVAIAAFYIAGDVGPEERFQIRARANTGFHRALVECANMRPLLQCWDTIEASFMALGKVNYSSLGEQKTEQALVREHTDLLGLIIALDEHAAIEELTNHIMIAKNDSIEGLKKLGWL